jgi:hypothetical protein
MLLSFLSNHPDPHWIFTVAAACLFWLINKVMNIRILRKIDRMKKMRNPIVLILFGFAEVERYISHAFIKAPQATFWRYFCGVAFCSSLVLLGVQLVNDHIIPPFALSAFIIFLSIFSVAMERIPILSWIYSKNRETKIELKEIIDNHKIIAEKERVGDEGRTIVTTSVTGKSVYHDFERDDSSTFAIFLAQVILYIFYGMAISDYLHSLSVNVGDHEDDKNASQVVANLDAFSYLRYVLGFYVTFMYCWTGNAGMESIFDFWGPMMYCWKHLTEEGSTMTCTNMASAREKEIKGLSWNFVVFRMSLDVIGNEVGRLFIIFSVPILFAQSDSLQDFAFNFGAAIAIWQFDDTNDNKITCEFLKKIDHNAVDEESNYHSSGDDEKEREIDIFFSLTSEDAEDE